MNLSHDITHRCAGPVPQREIANVEFARVTVTSRRVITRALGECKNARRVVEGKVLHGDVGCVAESAAAAVGWVAGAVARPGLYVGAVAHVVVDGDVADRDVLDSLEAALYTNC